MRREYTLLMSKLQLARDSPELPGKCYSVSTQAVVEYFIDSTDNVERRHYYTLRPTGAV